MRMMTHRQRRILQHLERSPGGIKGELLAKELGVSSRTLRTDLKSMENGLKAQGIRIGRGNAGYFLEDADPANLRAVLRESEAADETDESRVRAFAEALADAALQDRAVTQQDIADRLFLSLSTAKSVQKAFEQTLTKRGLMLRPYKNTGLRVEGEERRIRSFLARTLTAAHLGARSGDDAEGFRGILDEVLPLYGIYLSDEAREGLVKSLLVSLLRARTGHSIRYTRQETREVESGKEYEASSAVFDEMYRRMAIDVEASEVHYIAQRIMGSGRVKAEEVSPKLDALFNRMLERIKRVAHIELTADVMLREWLLLHLKAALPRMKFGQPVQNDALAIVKADYPLAFQLGLLASAVIEEEEGIRVDEHEVAYIAVHFGAALNRLRDRRRKRLDIIIACASGMGTAILLSARLQETFGDRIRIVRMIPGYALSREEVEGVDLVVSTVPLPHVPQEKFVLASHLLDEREMKAVEVHIKRGALLPAEIGLFFRPALYFANETHRDRGSVIERMTGAMIAEGVFSHAAKASVYRREEVAPTEIGRLVAIPHPIENDADVSAISVMTLAEPILWEEQKVQLVFLISIAKSDIALWESVFLKLFKYLTAAGGVEETLRADTYDAFMENFSRYMKKR